VAGLRGKLIYNIHKLWSIKIGHYIIGDNFFKCELIFTIFAPLGRQLRFQQNRCNISHFTLTLVQHYLEKFKILICLGHVHAAIIFSIRGLLTILLLGYYPLSAIDHMFMMSHDVISRLQLIRQ